MTCLASGEERKLCRKGAKAIWRGKKVWKEMTWINCVKNVWSLSWQRQPEFAGKFSTNITNITHEYPHVNFFWFLFINLTQSFHATMIMINYDIIVSLHKLENQICRDSEQIWRRRWISSARVNIFISNYPCRICCLLNPFEIRAESQRHNEPGWVKPSTCNGQPFRVIN